MEAHENDHHYFFDLVYKADAEYNGANYLVDPKDALKRWTEKESSYPYYGGEVPFDQNKWFTIAQLLWRKTERVGFGCALGYSKRKKGQRIYVVVANFDPQGNQVCEYKQNVWPRLDSALYKKLSAVPNWDKIPTSNCTVRPVVKPCHIKEPCSPTFQKEMLCLINNLRAKHGTPPLKISPEVSKFSQRWADYLSSVGLWMHQPNNRYHFDIVNRDYYTTKLGWFDTYAKDIFNNIMRDWGHYKYYGTEPPTEDERWDSSYIAAMLWRNSKYVGFGCSYEKSTGRNTFVANFEPYGNTVCEYKRNMLPDMKKNPSLYKKLTEGTVEPDPMCALTQEAANGCGTTSKPTCG